MAGCASNGPRCRNRISRPGSVRTLCRGKATRFCEELAFEQEFVHQAGVARDIEQTLSVAWRLLSVFPDSALKRIPRSLVARYRTSAK